MSISRSNDEDDVVPHAHTLRPALAPSSLRGPRVSRLLKQATQSWREEMVSTRLHQSHGFMMKIKLTYLFRMHCDGNDHGWGWKEHLF